jgi:hypothetical protein
MPTQTLQDILNSLAQTFGPELDRQFNRQSVLAEALPKRNGSGKNVAWDVRFSRTVHAAPFAEGAPVGANEFQNDVTVPATLGWGMYRVAFSLSGLAVAASTGSVGSALEMMDLFGTNLADAATDLVSQINTALYTGTGSGTTIAGLFGAGAIGATGSYANINRATYDAWCSNVLGNGGTARPLTKTLLDQMEESIYVACGSMPDIIICSPGVARSYEGLFDSIGRVFVERGDISALRQNPANVGAPVIPPNTGYTGLSYKGVPIYRDRDCPAGKLAMLNRQYVQIRTLPQVSLGTATTTREQELSGAPGNNTRITARIDSLAKEGDSDRFQLVTYLQLQVRKPNACGVIEDLN